MRLKETSYFKRLPPLCQLLTSSWALCPGSSIRQGEEQAGHAQQHLPRGERFPAEATMQSRCGVTQPAKGAQSDSGEGRGFRSPSGPMADFPPAQVERTGVCPQLPPLPSRSFPHPPSAFHSPVFLQGCRKLNISVYMHIYACTPRFSCSFTHPSLQRASKLNSSSCHRDLLGARSGKAGPRGAG